MKKQINAGSDFSDLSEDKNDDRYILPVYLIRAISAGYPAEDLVHHGNAFVSRSEFCVNDLDEDCYSGIGEWEAVVKIIRHALKKDEEVIIIARSNHVFSKSYSYKKLIRGIVQGNHLNSKLVFGNSFTSSDAFYLKSNLFWIRHVKKTSFVILYKSIFEEIINYDASYDNSSFESTLSSLTSNKLIMSPFIGKQLSASPAFAERNPDVDHSYDRADLYFNRLRINSLKCRKFGYPSAQDDDTPRKA